jgi:hypothetical protein
MNRLIAALAIALIARVGAAADTGFSTDNAALLLRTLSMDIGPRPMGSPAERRALAFAVGKLLEYGCDTAYVMPMTRTSAVNTSSGVAVGVLRGKTGRIIVLGGHIDSAGPEIPGANDDGSGTAVVLEAARVLGARELGSTIVFALFGGEEQGLEGSELFVDRFQPLDSVVLMLQVDMANGLGTIMVDPDAHGATAPAWLTRAAVEEFNGLGYRGLIYAGHYAATNYSMPVGSGSDHEPFLRAGIPAIDFTTDVGDPIHTQQDSYQNFEVDGLKRSGDLVLRLIDRFDAGTPDRTTGGYWLYLLFGYPLIVPIPAVWAFVAGAPLLGLFVLIRLRKAHLALRAEEGYVERKWTGLKLWVISLLVATLAWMSIDLLGLIKGVRFPWYAHFEYYYVPALLAAIFGLLAGGRLGSRLKVSLSPYVLFKRSFIALTILTALAAVGGVKIAVAPAVSLALLSAALLIPGAVAAAIAALLAPVWLFRLIFSEADSLLFRFTAPQLPGTFGMTAAINAVWVLILSLLLLAWLPGLAAVIRRRANPWTFIAAVKARRLMVITAGLFGICALVLLLVPAYDRPWYPNVQVEQVDMPGGDRDTVRVKSTEYLDGALIRYGAVDTTMEGRALRYSEVSALPAGPRWLDVRRDVSSEEVDSARAYDVNLTLATPFRPYTVSIVYTSARGVAPSIATPLKSTSKDGATKIAWYSFPDTALGAPVRFSVAPGDTVREEITVTFDSLIVPVDVTYREANLSKRTILRESAVYPGAPAAAPGITP